MKNHKATRIDGSIRKKKPTNMDIRSHFSMAALFRFSDPSLCAAPQRIVAAEARQGPVFTYYRRGDARRLRGSKIEKAAAWMII